MVKLGPDLEKERENVCKNKEDKTCGSFFEEFIFFILITLLHIDPRKYIPIEPVCTSADTNISSSKILIAHLDYSKLAFNTRVNLDV